MEPVGFANTRISIDYVQKSPPITTLGSCNANMDKIYHFETNNVDVLIDHV
jgi:hypothetical protein